MGQEFVIKSTVLEDKINQLLPSQGGAQAGVDLSASTMIVPIVDLTESAEGSNQRQDLQVALSLNDVTSFDVENTTSTLINTTGYFRVFGNVCIENRDSADNTASFSLTDGITTKKIYELRTDQDTTALLTSQNIDFIVFLAAGDSLTATSGNSASHLVGCTKQIADINGNLTQPS